MDDRQGISTADFARKVGLTSGRISQYKRAGMPVLADGSIDAAAAEAWMDENIDPARRRRRPAAAPGLLDQAPATGRPAAVPPEYTSVRTEHERLKHELTALQLARERGELVSRAEVERTVFALARHYRDASQNFVIRLAPLLAAEFDADERGMLAALDRHMREHLAELARHATEGLGDGSGNGRLDG